MAGPPLTRLVLWDLDGTLLHPAGFGRITMDTAFERLFGVGAPEGIGFAGRTDKAILREFIERGAPGAEHRQQELHDLACEIAERRRAEFVAGGARALPGAARAMESLTRLPWVIQSVLTGNLRRIGLIKLSEIGIGEHLDLRVAAFGDHDVRRSDLVTTAVDRVEREYGVRLGDRAVVVIGDTPLDVEAAMAHGALSVAVATGNYTTADLTAAGADLVLPDLTHLDELLAELAP